jgi:diguanylate cyclase (GGDEF)-like protein
VPIWSRKTIGSFFIPGGALLLASIIIRSFGWPNLTPPALSFLSYCAVLGGMILAWRFHSRRIFFVLCVLLISEQAAEIFGRGHLLEPAALLTIRAITVLLPANIVLISCMRETGLSLMSTGPAALFAFVESSGVFVLARSAQGTQASPAHVHHAAANLFPSYSFYAFAVAGIFLIVRLLVTRRATDSSLFWSFSALSLSLYEVRSAYASTLFFATAACILDIAIIENSYLLAYHDELTALPSRRAFNEALQHLVQPYSMAVVDIDHFKQFNDKYGHDTGDQVLKLVAGRLARVTGGGQAYRFGGEEFIILFSGKTTPQVFDHLEELRASIESSRFHLRGDDRRQAARGPDRRTQRPVSASRRKAEAIRQLSQEKSAPGLSVTVSIGVATSQTENSDSEVVLEAADKALYRAKDNGRNRVESAPARRRVGTRTAGIA